MKTTFVLAILFVGFMAIAGAEQIRKCTCDVQQKCFNSMKEEIEGCMDECEISVDFKSVVNETNNIGPCMEMRKKTIFDFFDCVNNECTLKDSCQKGKEEEKKVDKSDFEGTVVKHISKLAEKSLNKFEELGKEMKLEFVNVAVEMNKCGRECAEKKMKNLKCFEKQKCAIMVSDAVVQENVKKCGKQMDLNNKMFEVCQCFDKAGIKNLTPFCQKLKNADIPVRV